MNLLKEVYNRTLRALLPPKISVQNGVAVRGQIKLFDRNDEFPGYEAALCQAIREHVTPGDRVVVVGGGIGVSTVIAANQVCDEGEVFTFEGSESQFEKVKQTVEMNKVCNRVNINHAVVSEFLEDSVNRYGPAGSADSITPVNLPECDILELDCEGAELEILNEMVIRPSVIIVEAHGYLGSTPEDVAEAMNELGYTIVNREPELASRGVHVLTAVKKDNG